MDAFPAFVPLAGRRVIVVGEGCMAEEKAALFEGSPAQLLRRPADAHALEPESYAGATLVFIASEDESFAKAAAAAARAGGALLVNVVDKPPYCDFYTPAIVDRGAVVGAVGTTGKAPGLARRLKAGIDKDWPKHLDRLAALIEAMKVEARAALPDFNARKVYLESLLDGPAAEAALAGDAEAAGRIAREMLNRAAFPPDRGSSDLP
jgi:precorrin-2 dehydrogenase/sirohydrochlorin ferrochelatase